MKRYGRKIRDQDHVCVRDVRVPTDRGSVERDSVFRRLGEPSAWDFDALELPEKVGEQNANELNVRFLQLLADSARFRSKQRCLLRLRLRWLLQ